jgi:hypothetical protein
MAIVSMNNTIDIIGDENSKKISKLNKKKGIHYKQID